MNVLYPVKGIVCMRVELCTRMSPNDTATQCLLVSSHHCDSPGDNRVESIHSKYPSAVAPAPIHLAVIVSMPYSGTTSSSLLLTQESKWFHVSGDPLRQGVARVDFQAFALIYFFMFIAKSGYCL